MHWAMVRQVVALAWSGWHHASLRCVFGVTPAQRLPPLQPRLEGWRAGGVGLDGCDRGPEGSLAGLIGSDAGPKGRDAGLEVPDWGLKVSDRGLKVSD